MTENDIKQKLVDLIENTYLVEFGEDGLDFSSDLFESGVFDSMAMVNYTMFIEEEFGIEVDPDAIMDGKLTSIDKSVAYVSANQKQ